MKRDFIQYGLLLMTLFLSSVIQASTNFVTIKLPSSVTVDIPNNWVLLSNNQRITLDDAVTKLTFGLEQWEMDSRFPFAANYYMGSTTVGIINARYYPTMEFTQRDVSQFSTTDVHYLDQQLKQGLLFASRKVGFTVTSWEGTEKHAINGIIVFITEYHRESLKSSGKFRVRLVRVIAGNRSFTLTVSYLESQAFLLKNITDRIISSLTMAGYR